MMNERDPDCLFCRIVAGEIPSERVHEDDEVIVFRDINPQAPTHVLVVPRRHVASVADLADSDGGMLTALFAAVRAVAEKEGVSDYRVITNVGAGAGQSVFHLHLHLLAGRPMEWPPG